MRQMITCSVGPRVDAIPERVRDADGDDAIRARVTAWLEERRSLLAAVRSQVLPEADVVLMNPLHPDAARVPPLVTRPFSFAECLHTPPMLARYSGESDVRRSPHPRGGKRTCMWYSWPGHGTTTPDGPRSPVE